MCVGPHLLQSYYLFAFLTNQLPIVMQSRNIVVEIHLYSPTLVFNVVYNLCIVKYIYLMWDLKLEVTIGSIKGAS
jgi:hypothetical protein